MPWIAHWPAGIAPGGVSEQQCMTMDWSATLLDLGGARPPAGHALDGVSLAPVLRDGAQLIPRELFWRMKHRGQRALREGAWKYLRVDGHDYLFDLSRDERERANLGGREPERMRAMRARWEAWERSVPPIPDDAVVSLGYSAADMPQR